MRALAALALALAACGGTSDLPPSGDAGGDTQTADTPATGPYAGHPLVGAWEAPEPGTAGGAARRMFGADGSSAFYGYYNEVDMPGCRAATRGTDGTWMPAGDGAFTGSMMTLTLSRDCGAVSTPVRTNRSRDLDGRHTYTITGDTLRIDPETNPGGYVFRRVP